MKIALAQINTTVGDLKGNVQKIIGFLQESRQGGASLVVFPEMALTGYPPEDLLFKPSFIQANLNALNLLRPETRGLTAIVGFVEKDKRTGQLFNAAAVLTNGRVREIYRKQLLPNYGVFDEKRYFGAGESPSIAIVNGMRFGISVCEDIWQKNSFIFKRGYSKKIDYLINISASPYHVGKIAEREVIVRSTAKRLGKPVFYLNLVGGQDELVFDGGSMVVDSSGRTVIKAAQFREMIIWVDLPLSLIKRRLERPLRKEREIYEALTLGVKDYVRKNNFSKVVVGLSGGIDSALVASIAVDALGKQNVIGVTMPSPFTSAETLHDAKLLASNLGITCYELPITPIYQKYLRALRPVFSGSKAGIAEENLQARIRGNLVMALSNKFGYLVLTTGNKSEVATGYCTLYGDMAGGFAVIQDVPKTWVYQLVKYRNSLSERSKWIPTSTIRRAPTAELKHNQKDRDTLPPYSTLDRFINKYIENDEPLEKIVRSGFSKSLSLKLAALIDRNEYKRRQAAPGIKVTPKSFGRDRRMPITNQFQG